MFKLIQKETNRYATQQINRKNHEGRLKPNSVFTQWYTVSLQEIKKLVSIIIHMSMLRNLSFRNYWSMHPIHTPYDTSVGMSREKFLALLAMFHLNNNDAKVARGQPRYDLRSTIQNSSRYWHTHYKFQDVYTPEKQLPIDEEMCPFLSCLYQRKHHKYGM
jgi:hypothetical protein